MPRPERMRSDRSPGSASNRCRSPPRLAHRLQGKPIWPARADVHEPATLDHMERPTSALHLTRVTLSLRQLGAEPHTKEVGRDEVYNRSEERRVGKECRA